MNMRLSQLRSETGAISAGAAMSLVLLAAVVYIGLAAVGSDNAYFGRAPVPGKSAVELDKGGVEITYSEGTSAEGSFQGPPDLRTAIRDSAGIPLRVDSRGGEPEKTEAGTTQLIGSVQVPADGIYTVETFAAPAAGAVKPELLLGQSPLGAISTRAKDLAEQLIGPLGVLILAFLGVLYVIPKIQRRNKPSSHYSEF